MKKLRSILFGYFNDLPDLSTPKPYTSIVVNGKIRFVHSSVGERSMKINTWFKYISSKNVQKLYLNKIKS